MKSSSQIVALVSVFVFCAVNAGAEVACKFYNYEKLTAPEGSAVLGGTDYLMNGLGEGSIEFSKLPQPRSACEDTIADPGACSRELPKIMERETRAIQYLENAVKAKLAEFERMIEAAKAKQDQEAMHDASIRVALTMLGVEILLPAELSVFDYSPPAGMHQPYLEKDGVKPLSDAARKRLMNQLQELLSRSGGNPRELCQFEGLESAPPSGPSQEPGRRGGPDSPPDAEI